MKHGFLIFFFHNFQYVMKQRELTLGLYRLLQK